MARAEDSASDVSQTGLIGLVGYNLKRAYMRMHADFRDTLGQQGFTQRTFSVLSMVCENPQISQSEIARALGIERSGTVVIVDELEGKDLIVRDKVTGDRRTYALHATAAGRAAYQTALAAVQAHEARMLGELTLAEREQLRQLLSHIHRINKAGS